MAANNGKVKKSGSENGFSLDHTAPSLEKQKEEIDELLKTPLRKGETWYLVDFKWLNQWKKFVGFEPFDYYGSGNQMYNPGPIDNSALFKDDKLREHLTDEQDYSLLPELGWYKLSSWYGMLSGQKPIPRKVVESGLTVGHLEVEVYLMELRLCQKSDLDKVVAKHFSKEATLADIASVMKELFDITAEAETRLWNKYMRSFKLLSNMEHTVLEAGLYQGQVLIVEKKNKDGTWQRQTSSSSSLPLKKEEVPGFGGVQRSPGRGQFRRVGQLLPEVRIGSAPVILDAEAQSERARQESRREKQREWIEQLQAREPRAINAECQLLGEYQQQIADLKTKLMTAHQELRREREQRQTVDQRAVNAECQLRQYQQQITELTKNITTAQKEWKRERKLTEQKLQARQSQIDELRTSLTTTQRAIEEYRRSESPVSDWFISRDEVCMSDRSLGKGGWGTVVEGTFRSTKVAVKQIYELILSPHNRQLFEREMKIASRCRHPCLLQFIGATIDERPLFVTELMETSLRDVLRKRSLAFLEVSVISADVARALNYLHLSRPTPIVHRDISSANVLLWRQGEIWRGKVSDYGTANFVHQQMTKGPGAPIYSAPEAVTAVQSPKLDVYSFGVLLCEMCTRELPDPNKREQQIALVTNHVFRGVIRRCVRQKPEARPTIEEVIKELETKNTN